MAISSDKSLLGRKGRNQENADQQKKKSGKKHNLNADVSIRERRELFFMAKKAKGETVEGRMEKGGKHPQFEMEMGRMNGHFSAMPAQMMKEEEQPGVQKKEEEPAQKQEEEEEAAQPKMEEEKQPAQKQEEEEEAMQTKMEEEGKPAQKQEEEETAQTKMEEEKQPAQKQEEEEAAQPAQMKKAQKPASKKNDCKGGAHESLPAKIQKKMEQALRVNLSNIKIHKDCAKAQKLGAKAFTRGNDIHFAPGHYDPFSKKGQELLGHELAHVVQQRQGRVKAERLANGVALNEDSGLEREADEVGAKIAQMD